MFLRRFPGELLFFVLLWSLWFMLPATREAAKGEWSERLFPSENKPLFPSKRSELPQSSPEAALIFALDARSPTLPRSVALAKAGRLFPHDVSICAAQLVFMCDDLQLIGVRQRVLFRTSRMRSPSFSAPASPQFLKRWFEVTARGANLEPNNTFWDWMQIVGLLAAHRNDEVWAILRAARDKTIFDDHTDDSTLARVKLARLATKTVPPSTQVYAYGAVLIRYVGLFRDVALLVSDDAARLRLQNIPQSRRLALEGAHDLATLARVMRRQSRREIISYFGLSIEQNALFAPSTLTSFWSSRRTQTGIRSSVMTYASARNSLLAFARQEGRPDMIAQLSQQWSELGQWRVAMYGLPRTNFVGQFDARDIVLAQIANEFGPLVLAGIPSLLFLVLVCSLLLPLVPERKNLPPIQLAHSTWSGGAGLAFLSVSLLSSAALWAMAQVWLSKKGTFWGVITAPASGYMGINGLAPLSWQYHFPAVVGGLTALWWAVRWQNQRNSKPALTMRLRTMLQAPEDGLARFDFSPLLLLASIFAAFFTFVGGTAAFLTLSTKYGYSFKWLHYAGWGLTLMTLAACLPALWQLTSSQARTAALLMARRLAWGQLLFLTCLWGALWVVAGSAQKRFDVAFAHRVQTGEVQIARKQLGL